ESSPHDLPRFPLRATAIDVLVFLWVPLRPEREVHELHPQGRAVPHFVAGPRRRVPGAPVSAVCHHYVERVPGTGERIIALADEDVVPHAGGVVAPFDLDGENFVGPY